MKTHHLLILELLSHVTGARAGNLNPSLGEECTGRYDKENVNGGVNGVEDSFFHGVRRGHIVSNSRYGVKLR